MRNIGKLLMVPLLLLVVIATSDVSEAGFGTYTGKSESIGSWVGRLKPLHSIMEWRVGPKRTLTYGELEELHGIVVGGDGLWRTTLEDGHAYVRRPLGGKGGPPIAFVTSGGTLYVKSGDGYVYDIDDLWLYESSPEEHAFVSTLFGHVPERPTPSNWVGNAYTIESVEEGRPFMLENGMIFVVISGEVFLRENNVPYTNYIGRKRYDDHEYHTFNLIDSWIPRPQSYRGILDWFSGKWANYYVGEDWELAFEDLWRHIGSVEHNLVTGKEYSIKPSSVRSTNRSLPILMSETRAGSFGPANYTVNPDGYEMNALRSMLYRPSLGDPLSLPAVERMPADTREQLAQKQLIEFAHIAQGTISATPYKPAERPAPGMDITANASSLAAFFGGSVSYTEASDLPHVTTAEPVPVAEANFDPLAVPQQRVDISPNIRSVSDATYAPKTVNIVGVYPSTVFIHRVHDLTIEYTVAEHGSTREETASNAISWTGPQKGHIDGTVFLRNLGENRKVTFDFFAADGTPLRGVAEFKRILDYTPRATPSN